MACMAWIAEKVFGFRFFQPAHRPNLHNLYRKMTGPFPDVPYACLLLPRLCQVSRVDPFSQASSDPPARPPTVVVIAKDRAPFISRVATRYSAWGDFTRNGPAMTHLARSAIMSSVES